MAFGLAVLGGEEGLYQIPGDSRANRAATHTEDIHMIILHALPGREMIMNKTGTNTGYLVRSHRRADSAATDGQATFDLAGSNSLCQWNDEVGIIIGRVQMMSAKVNHLMTGLAKLGDDLLF